MKRLSDLVNDSDEDCSGESAKVIFISVTELFTVLREWLFGIWTKVNWRLPNIIAAEWPIIILIVCISHIV